MKIQSYAYILLMWALLGSCNPVVTFQEPQPVSIAALDAFPNRLKGEYRSVEDSSLLTIDDKIILRKYDFYFPFDSNILGKDFAIQGDSLFNLETKEQFLLVKKNKQFFIQIKEIDTLFHLSNVHVLKKFKGQYFLNTHFKDEGWALESIRFSRDGLTMSKISPEKEVQSLKEIKRLAQDSEPHSLIEFSKMESKQFNKSKGFPVHEKFIQLK